MSTSKSKPRGVHEYTDGRGRRCYRIEYVGTDGTRRFKRLGPVNLRAAIEARENLNVSIRRRELIVTGEARAFGEVRQEWVEARTIRKRTEEAQDAHLRHHCQRFEHRKITDIGKGDLLALLGQLRRIRGTPPCRTERRRRCWPPSRPSWPTRSTWATSAGTLVVT